MDDDTAFTEFFARVEPLLRRALIAAYGPDIGREATAEAMAYAWENWRRIARMDNAPGYLYRVGQSRSRRLRRRLLQRFPATGERRDAPWVEPALASGLESLSTRQRQCIVLVHGFEWTRSEVAEMTGLSQSAVRTHIDRGLTALRQHLEVSEVG